MKRNADLENRAVSAYLSQCGRHDVLSLAASKAEGYPATSQKCLASRVRFSNWETSAIELLWNVFFVRHREIVSPTTTGGRDIVWD